MPCTASWPLLTGRALAELGVGWSSHDSLTITKMRGTSKGQVREPGSVLQMGTDWPLPFKEEG